jgi:predicted amidophosphoribosyltransferase
MRLSRGLADAGLDLLTGSRCAGCSRPGRALCRGCATVLAGLRPRPGRPSPPPSALLTPTALPLVCSGAYDGLLANLVVAHKEERRLALAGPLGRLLATAVESALADGTAGSGGVALVPVPSTSQAVLARGHDPLLRITRAAAARLRRRGIDCTVAPVLVHRRQVADQAGLSATQRVANLDGAFQARCTGPLSRSIIVVDDVVTTGASLAAAVTALRDAGAEPVAAATIAATARRNPPRAGAVP